VRDTDAIAEEYGMTDEQWHAMERELKQRGNAGVDCD
jgi:hypothetical protein